MFRLVGSGSIRNRRSEEAFILWKGKRTVLLYGAGQEAGCALKVNALINESESWTE